MQGQGGLKVCSEAFPIKHFNTEIRFPDRPEQGQACYRIFFIPEEEVNLVPDIYILKMYQIFGPPLITRKRISQCRYILA